MITNKKIPALCARILEVESKKMGWTAGSDGTFKVGRSGEHPETLGLDKQDLALAMSRALALRLSWIISVSPLSGTGCYFWRTSATVYGRGVLNEIFEKKSSDLLTPGVLFTLVLNDAQARMVSRGLYAVKRRKANAE